MRAFVYVLEKFSMSVDATTHQALRMLTYTIDRMTERTAPPSLLPIFLPSEVVMSGAVKAKTSARSKYTLLARTPSYR